MPMAADLQRPAKLAAKLNDLRNYLLGDLRDLRHADALTRKIYLDLVDYDLRMLASTYETIAKVVRVVSGDYLHSILKTGCTIFEGRRAFCLDENNGLFPHVTGTTTTLANAEAASRRSRHLWAGSPDRHPAQLYDPAWGGAAADRDARAARDGGPQQDHRMGGRLPGRAA